MIKSVSKQILEVNNTENEYFDKVVFYIKPEYSNMSYSRLRFEAALYAKGGGRPPMLKRRRIDTFLNMSKLALAAAAGAAVCAAIMQL